MKLAFNFALVCAALSSLPTAATASLLFTNGTINTGISTTTVTAGDPISNPETFATSGTFNFTTAGTNVKGFTAADDFVLPVTCQLSTFTVYAYQSQSTSLAGTKTPVPLTAAVNLWNTTPVTGGSPILATNLSLTPISSTFIGWRQSPVPGSTNGTRPIFAYTFDASGLPNAGLLIAGTYWLQWQLDNGTSASLLTPLVTPKATAFNTNFRLYGVPAAGYPVQWFETWEGGDPNTPRPYAAPFEINGTFIPEPASAALLAPLAALVTFRPRRTKH